MGLETLKISDIKTRRETMKESPSAVNLSRGGSTWLFFEGSTRQFLIYGGVIANFSNEEVDKIGDKYNFEAYQKRSLIENRKLLLKYVKEGLVKI